MTVAKVSPVSVIGTKGYFSENERLDMYFVHPEKIDALEYLKNVANSNGFDVVELQQVLENPPESGRSARGEAGPVMVIKPGKLTSDFIIDTNNVSGTTEEDYLSSEKGQLKNGDILLLSAAHAAGYIGRNTSIFLNENGRKAMCIGELIRVRPNKDEIEPFYLLGYLNTHYVRTLLKHSVRGQTVHLYPNDVRNLPVILPPRDEQESIGKKLKESIERKIEAKKKREEIDTIFAKYLPVSEAEEILSEKLSVSFSYNLKSTIEERRLDPRYFAPAYEKIINLLKQSQYCIKLRNLRKKYIRGNTPASVEFAKSGKILLKVASIGDDGMILWKNVSYVDDGRYQRFHQKHQLTEGDVLITACGVSVGKVSILYKDFECAITGELVAICCNSSIKPYYLFAFLRTTFGQAQIKRYAMTASGPSHLYPYQIDEFLIPIIDEEVQEAINTKAKEYFSHSEAANNYKMAAMAELKQLLSPGGKE